MAKNETQFEIGGFKFNGVRWVIIGMIFFATLINYIDRLTLSVLGKSIKESFNLSDTEFGVIGTWFLLAYTISQGLSGKLYDRIGIKKGFSVSIVVWSIAAMLHAFATGLASLSLFRFILGLGEAGNWPGAAKTVAEWFPARQRALAMGIFNSGAAIGSIVATPIIGGLALYFGHWYEVFIITGALGFIWLIFWWFIYDSPENHKWLTKREYDLIREDDEPKIEGLVEEKPLGWLELLKYRQTWAIILTRFLVDPVWWLYIFWLPLMLYKVYGFDLKQMVIFGWFPYVAADAGSLLGGWFSGFLIGRGWSVNNARKAVIAFAAITFRRCHQTFFRNLQSVQSRGWAEQVPESVR
jgi:MFS transporter, ACS family, hexuronate transporter